MLSFSFYSFRKLEHYFPFVVQLWLKASLQSAIYQIKNNPLKFLSFQNACKILSKSPLKQPRCKRFNRCSKAKFCLMNLFIHKCPSRPYLHGKHCLASPPHLIPLSLLGPNISLLTVGRGGGVGVVKALYLDSGFFS